MSLLDTRLQKLERPNSTGFWWSSKGKQARERGHAMLDEDALNDLTIRMNRVEDTIETVPKEIEWLRLASYRLRDLCMKIQEDIIELQHVETNEPEDADPSQPMPGKITIPDVFTKTSGLFGPDKEKQNLLIRMDAVEAINAENTAKIAKELNQIRLNWKTNGRNGGANSIEYE